MKFMNLSLMINRKSSQAKSHKIIMNFRRKRNKRKKIFPRKRKSSNQISKNQKMSKPYPNKLRFIYRHKDKKHKEILKKILHTI